MPVLPVVPSCVDRPTGRQVSTIIGHDQHARLRELADRRRSSVSQQLREIIDRSLHLHADPVRDGDGDRE
jgi:hypothetical protein